jgi:hypothetical protein
MQDVWRYVIKPLRSTGQLPSTSINIKKKILRSAPHSVFMCFVQISQERAIISLYIINRLVFITEKESIYCAVRTGSLNVIQVNPQRPVYTVRSESRYALRLRYVDLVVSIEVTVEVCCCFTVFSCSTAVEVQYR